MSVTCFYLLLKKAEQDGSFEIVTDEYKRRKPGFTEFNEKYFNIRGISIHRTITDGRTLYSKSSKTISAKRLMSFLR